MPSGKHLSGELKARMFSLLENKLTCEYVAKVLGISVATVYQYHAKWVKVGALKSQWGKEIMSESGKSQGDKRSRKESLAETIARLDKEILEKGE